MSAAGMYAERVDAVIEQRTRLRGPQPPGDLFAGLPPTNPMFRSDPRRQIEPNLAIIAEYVEPEDVIVDVGGGAGRVSLPLALRCREVIDVDPSVALISGFGASATEAGIANARAIRAEWVDVDPPHGTFALVNHVTYLTREIVPFVKKLEAAATRRVLITVNSPPPPSLNRDLFHLLFNEEEQVVPGLAELVNVLWEVGIEPDMRMLPEPTGPYPAQPTRQAAIDYAIARFTGDQWALWPLGMELETRLRGVLEARFDELFTQTATGYAATWIKLGREVLITWEPRK